MKDNILIFYTGYISSITMQYMKHMPLVPLQTV